LKFVLIPTRFTLDAVRLWQFTPPKWGSTHGYQHPAKIDRRTRYFQYLGNGRCAVLVTEKGHSYLHGWSPDGQRLAYCAELPQSDGCLPSGHAAFLAAKQSPRNQNCPFNGIVSSNGRLLRAIVLAKTSDNRKIKCQHPKLLFPDYKSNTCVKP
jgi:hypothetical protein